jgi:hypothetical protein
MTASPVARSSRRSCCPSRRRCRRPQRRAVQRARGDSDGQPARHGRLAAAVVAPADDGAIGPQRQAVVATRGDGGDGAQPARHGCLAQGAVAPADDGTVGPQRRAVVHARGDGVTLLCAPSARSPCHSRCRPGRRRAVGLQRQAVRVARRWRRRCQFPTQSPGQRNCSPGGDTAVSARSPLGCGAPAEMAPLLSPLGTVVSASPL